MTDPDGSATVSTWKWYRGSTLITTADAEDNDNTYTVVADDVSNNRIRVEATYSDGGGAEETVRFTSENPVQVARPARLTNEAPEFASATVTRRVEENSTGNVGGPVTATDGDDDKLTYTISGDDATFTPTDGEEMDRFTINAATGQVMAAVKLNYEDTTNTDRSYTVTVTATDSTGMATVPAAMVTINVIDVDEKPKFATTSPAAGVLAAQTEGRTDIDGDDDPTTVAADLAYATFVATDPDGEEVTLTLMGKDAGSFELADDTDTGNGVKPGTLLQGEDGL